MWRHILPGRVRAWVPGLKRNPALAERLRQMLENCAGVQHVRANPVTGTVLIAYDPAAVGLPRLAQLLAGDAAAEVAAALEPSLPALPCTEPPAGLSADEVRHRLALYGPNLLKDPPRRPFAVRFLSQYQGAMPWTLMLGAGLSLLSGQRRDTLLIMTVMLLNGLLGASQPEGSARAVGALRAWGNWQARAVRDGRAQSVPAAGLVPGDLLLLAAGDRVPADTVVSDSQGLAADESLVTGESAAVEKAAGDVLYAGSGVVRGRGAAVVTATGMSSALGKVAELLATADRPSRLQQQLDQLEQRTTRTGAWLAAGVAGMGLLRGRGPTAALADGVSLAISALPEGLSTVARFALAAGADRVARRHGSFQNSEAVEQMGAVTALCMDKTGTLTCGEMTVAAVHLPDSVWRVTGTGYIPEGDFIQVAPRKRAQSAGSLHSGLRRLLQVAALAADARLELDDNGYLITRGDPTDLALVVAALKAGLRAGQNKGDRLLEIPFDSARRRVTMVFRGAAGQALACVKGAPEALLPLCTRVFVAGTVRPLDPQLGTRMMRAASALAARGQRVLAAAYQPVAETVTPEDAEQNLILLGLLGLADSPRAEATAMVRRARNAGVKVIMMTGDHPGTAAAVARQIALPADPGTMLTGTDLDQLDDAALERRLQPCTVVSRVTPSQKVRVIQALRRSGQTVAMAGDGVNDAPAMRAADIGVTMDHGTAVARATAGLILEDGHLLAAVEAIAQGRATGGNIRRAARYLLESNAARLLLMSSSLLLGLPLPLLPTQLLWMNLFGDSLPTMALSTEPPEPGLMNQPPRQFPMPAALTGHSLGTGLAATGLYAWSLATGRSLPQARSLAMATLVAGQIRHLFACRSQAKTPMTKAAGISTAGLALSAIYLPPFRNALQFAPVSPADLALAVGAAFAVSAFTPGGRADVTAGGLANVGRRRLFHPLKLHLGNQILQPFRCLPEH